MANLWSSNTPACFWQCQDIISEEVWQIAVKKASPLLNLPGNPDEINQILEMVLGEGQFGKNHWSLNPSTRAYYKLKPIIPRYAIKIMRKIYHRPFKNDYLLSWPIEDRYVRFLWEVMHQVLLAMNQPEMSFKWFWTDKKEYAFILTHDVETEDGFAHILDVANFEESVGFRSSFNIVPERYPVDFGVLNELKQRGFEIGVHGLKHDAYMFESREAFNYCAEKVNHYFTKFGSVGFRSPYTHRQPEWMQDLNMEYDSSFFDTDPFEPIPGGTMSIWPFRIYKFIELPYSLIQDNSLVTILGEKTPKIWLDKINYIRSYHGMALLDSHPDYLKNKINWNVYVNFINRIIEIGDYWHALPKEVARWWRFRTENDTNKNPSEITFGKIKLNNNDIEIF
jgi:hypothetical protein